jgi:diaminohydroxyphosphoribosylaminopyrimidine deaminase / 5-amino-6-(5-phosphoribosylamino)uracil reductase
LVISKAAMSLDGKIATHIGDSKWITSEAARREAHKLRSHVDAIMVGANTVIRDDPQLTMRHGVRGKQPWRVVVDGRGRTPRIAKLFSDAHRERTIVLTTSISPAPWRKNISRSGAHVFLVKGNDGHMNLRAALRVLGKIDITSVLVEGGSELLGALFDQQLVDKVALFYAPIVIGGRDAIAAIAGKGALKVKNSVRLLDCQWRRIGQDEMLVEARVKK